MKPSPITPLALVTGLLLLGCGGSGGGQDGGTVDRPEGPAQSSGTEAAGARQDDPAADNGSGAVCLRGEDFTGTGAIPVDDSRPGDARRLTGYRWAAHDGCERLVFELDGDQEGRAVAAGSVGAEVLRELGVVRVSLRGVTEVAPGATEEAFDGRLTEAVYATRATNGRWIDIDVILAAPAEARVALMEDPARAVLDLRPGGGEVPDPPVKGSRVVVLEPRPGPATYPLTVRGYARTFEANVVVRLEQDGRDVHETFTTATAWTDAWGRYSVTIEDGPRGAVRLHVGEHSTRDGSWQGVKVPLEMR